MENALQIGIIGVVLSGVVQWIKLKYGPTSLTTKLIIVGFSVAISGVYYFLKDTLFWQTALAILGIASTVYALFIK